MTDQEHSAIHWEDLPELMDELRDVARRLLARWPGMESLQPTLLVNMALEKQRRQSERWDEITWERRQQLFGHVFRAMRQALVDYRIHQRTRGYLAQRRISVAEMELFDAWRRWTHDPDMALALDAALERLSVDHPELAELVQYRFFAGLKWRDVGEMLGCSESTITRRWEKARVLMQEIISQELADTPSA
jgi:DNA-directed RNA polymerase specialized sigma24 family protein